MSAKNSGGPNFSASAVSGAASSDEAHGRDDAADERADRRDGERRAGAALLRHLVAVEAGDGGGASPGTLTSTEVSVPPYIAP